MLFAAALVASVPCDGSPALACEVNTLAPTNSSGVWALMGGHDIKLYQPVSDVLTVTPPPGVAPKALELVFVHGVYHGGWYWHGFQKELAVLGYTSHSFTFATDMTKHIWTMANDLMAFVQANVTGPYAIIAHSAGGHTAQQFLLTNNLALPAAQRASAAVLMNSGSIVMADSAPNLQCFMNVTVAPLAAAGIFNGSITCNGALTKALFMLNTTALTSVTGELLDPLQYSCKLNAVSAQNLSSVDTWTFAYASAPKDVTTPAGAPLPLLVSQVDTDPFQNCLGRGHIQAKIAEFWGAAAVETVDFVEMGHVHAEGWDAKVVPPLAAWLDKAA